MFKAQHVSETCEVSSRCTVYCVSVPSVFTHFRQPWLCVRSVCYSHVHLAQVAVAVLDDVSMFRAVEHRDRTFVAL